MGSLHDLTALEQAAALRAGEIGTVELVEHYLGRIDRWSETVGAFVTVTGDRALDRARTLQQVLRGARSGSAAEGGLPALYGVPTALKDLEAEAGVPMMRGSAAFRDHVPDVDDHVVTLLRSAGLISLGKTNTPEFGLPCYTESEVAPPARTPWDLDCGAGGSSGGAAAAVAAGLAPLAQGSDGGGSIRIPASLCGLVGLKTSRGRVSSGPAGGEITGLTGAGPLGRTVPDTAALLDAMAVPMPGDPYWAAPLPPGETFLAAALRDPRRLRIGRYRDNVLGAPVHPDCVAAWEAASALLALLGHEVEDCAAPALGQVWDDFALVWSVLAATTPVPADRETLLRPLTRWLRERGRTVTATEFATAVTSLQVAARGVIRDTAAYDAVLTPTLAAPPTPVGALRDDADPAHDFELQSRFTPYTAVYNMLGLPAISLPLQRSGAGLPIGVQLVGRPAGEAALLSLAGQIERATPWAGEHPPLWDG